MNIRKCDICKKTIKDRNFLRISQEGSPFTIFEICLSCAQPITKFLKSKKLIKDENKDEK